MISQQKLIGIKYSVRDSRFKAFCKTTRCLTYARDLFFYCFCHHNFRLNHLPIKIWGKVKSVKVKKCQSWRAVISGYLPMVGMVVTISPSLSLYKIVVFPAASSPTIKILICFLAKSRLKSELMDNPMLSPYLQSPLRTKNRFWVSVWVRFGFTDKKRQTPQKIRCFFSNSKLVQRRVELYWARATK